MSGDTRFLGFALPSEPDVVAAFLERSGQSQRRYFPKRPGEGEPIRHLAAEGTLFKHLLSEVGTAAVKGYVLDDKVHADYASLLLPRAVGYSAALIDYFFRGRLDVKLTPDPDDPTNPNTVVLAGVNASSEALSTGRIALYADDKASGQRFEAVALDPTDVSAVPSGAGLPRMRFVVPADAERFMVVYQGTLGDEVKTGTFVGAVIGKALGGVRVEEVFNDGATWKLRTPAGVFDTPLTTAEFEQVKWGDDSSTVVARSPMGSGQPNRVVAYKVKRQPGSTSFVIDADAGPSNVVVDKAADVPFPFGLNIGTTVNFSQTVVYNQAFPRVERTITGNGPGCANATETFGSLTLETATAGSAQASMGFAITLDAERQEFVGSIYTPYVWRIQDIAADGAGRILALIAVTLTDPGVPPTQFMKLTVGPDGGLVPATNLGPSSIGVFFPFFPGRPQVWALIDVSAGTVVASTAEPVLSINVAGGGVGTVFEQGLWVHTTTNDPDCGPGGWSPWRSLPGSYTPTVLLDVHPPADGTISVAGVVRSDLATALASAGFVDSWQVTGGPEQPVEFLTFPCGVEVCQYRVFRPSPTIRRPPMFDARRASPASAGERLVLFAQDSSAPTGTLNAVVAWDAEASTAKVPFSATASSSDATQTYESYQMGAVSNGSAIVLRMVESGDIFGPNYRVTRDSKVVLLDTPDNTIDVPGTDLVNSSFTLLGPSYLYNTDDLRFYAASPALQQTSLPARLADAGGNPYGDYHLITLP